VNFDCTAVNSWGDRVLTEQFLRKLQASERSKTLFTAFQCRPRARYTERPLVSICGLIGVVGGIVDGTTSYSYPPAVVVWPGL
jgi:hypothetical protein